MLKNKGFKKLLLLSFFALVACQTHPYIIPESFLPVADHRKAIVAVIGDARIVSQNGRDVISHFHDRNFKFIDDPNKVKVRYYTKVSVLGPRRPYEVAVEVMKEQKDPDSKKFIDQGLDDSLSQRRLVEVANMLNQSRDKPQSIDVENPF